MVKGADVNFSCCGDDEVVNLVRILLRSGGDREIVVKRHERIVQQVAS